MLQGRDKSFDKGDFEDGKIQNKSKGPNFGSSQFKGQSGFKVESYKWFIQFITLLIKNFVIISRKPIQLLIFLLLPGTFFLTFLIELNDYGTDTGNDNLNFPTIPIQNLGSCEAYYKDNCIRIVYDNAGDIKTNAIMNELIISNNLDADKDIFGFDTQIEAQQFVSDNVGRVQFTIFFRNESLWETTRYSPNNIPLAKNMSYVIFYNESTNNDSRSKKYNLNFPLLVLQKSLDEAYLKTNYPNKFKNYLIDYGEIWSYSVETSVSYYIIFYLIY
jgi:hypothetical protein